MQKVCAFLFWGGVCNEVSLYAVSRVGQNPICTEYI